MSNRIIFSSVESPNIRYVAYESFTDNPTSGNGISDRLTSFDTYGDGNVQHSHEWRVQPDKLADFLESLALFMDATPVEEWLPVLVRLWPDEIHEKNSRVILAFASRPLFKEDNHQFSRTYNLRECKVSTADSKRHDKRWEAVQSWMDGTFAAVMGLTQDYRPNGLLGLYSWCNFVFENSDFSQYDFRKWMKMEPETHRRILHVFDTCNDYIRAAERIRRVREWHASRCENLRYAIVKRHESPTVAE